MSFTEPSLRQAAYRESLRQCSMFSGLSDELLDPLLDLCEVRQWPKGSYLFRQGDPMTGFFLVRRGAVSIQRLAPNGSEKVIHVFRANQTFAEGALPSPCYPADALAVTESETIRIAKVGFMKLLRSKNEFALRTILSLSRHLRILVDDIEGQQQTSAVAKLAGWLLQRAGDASSRNSIGIDLGMSKQDLAAELRMRSETLSRTFAKLQAAGLLSGEGKDLFLPDIEGLRRTLNGE